MYFHCDAPQIFDYRIAHRAVYFRVEDFTPEAAEQVSVTIPVTMDKAVAKRKAEYVAGRLCAMRAIEAQTGQAGVTIAGGDKGEPVWPAGLVGSITHTHGFAAAVVADASVVRGLGIDTEQVMTTKVMDNVGQRICRPEEAYCVDCPISPEIYTTLVFSAKESLFKCLYPLVGKMFWFEDARIEVSDYASGQFTAILTSDLNDEFCNAVRLQGCFRLTPGLVHTGITLPMG
ncbi:4'-phosphopantetheinyl transferase superfamily protein [Rhizobium sp.]|jgi:enterobactin synthetase component D|uniref:4'-phosphopantetheinyl transferase family protein n=1 Tax=Rhizobium sp. TaxID=391 RepID=UPI000E87E584|nr:phosphopantetheinyl transferase [Rhizobium sp.]